MHFFADILSMPPRMMSLEPSDASKFFGMCGNLAKVVAHHSVDFLSGNIRTARSVGLKWIVIKIKFIFQ